MTLRARFLVLGSATAGWSAPLCARHATWITAAIVQQLCVTSLAGAGRGDCCVPGAAPGCENEKCAAIVCTVDPYCCLAAWDGICAETSQLLCEQCAVAPPANDDCRSAQPVFEGAAPFSTIGATTDGLPHQLCDSGRCQGSFNAYRDVWFTFAAGADAELLVSTCGSADFDAKVVIYDSCDCDVEPNQLHSCSDVCFSGVGGEALIHARAGRCYLIRVGSAAAMTGDGVLTIGPPIGTCPSAQSCCQAQSSPGCDDIECCDAVCAMDSFCCQIAWDAICANEASLFCIACGAVDCLCLGSTGRPCCAAHRGYGCDDYVCCESVCAREASCCLVEWDAWCATIAAHFCQPMCAANPADIAPPGGDGMVGAADLAELLAQWGDCAKADPCPADIAPAPSGDAVVDAADLAELLANWS